MKDESIQQQRSPLHMPDERRDSRFVSPDRERKLIAARSFHARACFVLGDDWRDRFAQALQCSPARFNSPPQPLVEAVLELLEVALNDRICADPDLPPRWHTSTVESEQDDLRVRFTKLLGGDRITTSVAAAAGLSVDTVRFAWSRRSSRCASDLLAAVELLELLQARGATRDVWPSRWRSEITSRLSAKDSPMLVSGNEVECRFREIFDASYTNARLGCAIDLSPEYLGRVWRGERDSQGRPARVQGYLVAVLELLETLKTESVPIERWPERWRIFPDWGR